MYSTTVPRVNNNKHKDDELLTVLYDKKANTCIYTGEQSQSSHTISWMSVCRCSSLTHNLAE